MRMRPQRLILGELRGREVIPFLLAMNTGHRGLLSTLHANSAVDAIERVATLFSLYSSQEIPYQHLLKMITQNIDAVIFLERGEIKEAISVLGQEKGHIFYESLLNF